MTNFEKIKQMSVEEIVVLLDSMQCRCYSNDCQNCPIYKIADTPRKRCMPQDIMNWLESEVQEDE